MWGRQSYRWSDLDFDANAKDGISRSTGRSGYADIAPLVPTTSNNIAGISGSLSGWRSCRTEKFQPPDAAQLRRIADRRTLRQKFGGRRRIIPGRTANLTRPLPGRTHMPVSHRVLLGCPYGGYFSTQSSTLPAAVGDGRLTLKPFRDRHGGAVRPRQETREWRARARRSHGADDRLQPRASSSSAPPR